jgi:hypothetical protein
MQQLPALNTLAKLFFRRVKAANRIRGVGALAFGDF